MKNMHIAFSPPDITEEEIAEVVDTLRSGWITTGPKTKLFEKNVVIRRIPLRSHDTLYVHIGDAVEDGLLAFFFIYIAALGTGCIIRARKKAKA